MKVSKSKGVCMKGSFVRFLVVGLVNTGVGLSIMYVLLHIFHHYWAATFVGNAAGAVVSYVLNRIFTLLAFATVYLTILDCSSPAGYCTNFLLLCVRSKKTSVY